nr:helix-turn-helix domain-containing protein [uncultured Roseibium sp.]
MNVHCLMDRRGDAEKRPDESPAAKSFACDDIDQFSGLFHGVTLEGIQLSPGKFDANVVFAPMNEASIHLSQCAHTVEMRMDVEPERFLFCVCIGEDNEEQVFGARDPASWIFVLPPEGGAAMPAPENSTLLTLSVASKVILESEILIPEARAWFETVRPEGEFVRSKRLASRMKEDVMLALLGGTGRSLNGGSKSGQSVSEAMMSGIMSAFSLEWLIHDGIEVDRRTPAADRFFRARRLICEHDFTIGDGLNDALSRLGSTRSVEQAFASHVKMGPHSYARAIRLHNARRRLCDKHYSGESVGNIAAFEGFWDCSRFALYYRKHFGEQPSQTRKKRMIRQGSPNFPSLAGRFRH